MNPFKDHYHTLKISPAATQAEIKAAFKKQSFKWHPDRNPGFDTVGIMQEINEAKRVLLNPLFRESYDQEYALFNAGGQQYQPESTTAGGRERMSKTKEAETETNEWVYWLIISCGMSLLSQPSHMGH